MLPRRAQGRETSAAQDHLRHATEKRRRLEQTGIRQLNRQSECRSDEPAASKLLELDQDFTAQWTRARSEDHTPKTPYGPIGVPGINIPARRLWYLIPVSYCTVRYYSDYRPVYLNVEVTTKIKGGAPGAQVNLKQTKFTVTLMYNTRHRRKLKAKQNGKF